MRATLRAGPWPLLLALFLAGCGSETSSGSTSSSTDDGSTTSTCTGADTELPDGRCQPPGLPLDMPCPPGETPLPDGTCQSAGVPPSACGDGFEADGSGGCRPILPVDACPDGLLAVPGDTECHEIAPCGEGTWGDIPVEANTQFVDGSYAGMDSDGSQEKPWKTVQNAIAVAETGAIVAVAEGTYEEGLSTANRRVRVWGVCPSKVTFKGTSAVGDAFAFFNGPSEIHSVAFTGPGMGVYVGQNTGVLLDGVWIHDTKGPGLVAYPGAKATLHGSLVERAVAVGVQGLGGNVTIDRSSVRDTEPGPAKLGILVGSVTYLKSRPLVTITDSLLENVYMDAVNAIDTDVTMERTAVRTMRDDTPGDNVPRGGLLGGSATMIVRQSTFEGMPVGVLVSGSQATVEDVTVFGGESIPPQFKGIRAGIYVQSDPDTLEPANLLLRESTVAHQPEFGVGVDEASVTMESSLLVGNVTDIEGVAFRTTGADITLSHSAILDSHHAGMSLEGTKAVLDSCLVRGVQPTTHAGYCIGTKGYVGEPETPAPASLTLVSTQVEDCYEGGIDAIEADLVIQTSLVRNVKPRSEDGLFGDGVVLMSATPGRGSTKIDGTRVEKAARAGIAAFGSTIDLGHSASLCASFPLAGETFMGVEFQFIKTGDNACGCPAAADLCKIDSPGLTAPNVE